MNKTKKFLLFILCLLIPFSIAFGPYGSVWRITSDGAVINENIVIPDAGYIGPASVPTAGQFEADGDLALTQKLGIGGSPQTELYVASTDSTLPVFRLLNGNDDTSGSRFQFFKDSSSPADNDQIGHITGIGRDSAGSATEYAWIYFYSADITNGDEAGWINFTALMDGTERSLLQLKGYNGSVNQGEVKINSGKQDVDFVVGTALALNGLTVNGADGSWLQSSADNHGGLYRKFYTASSGTFTAAATITIQVNVPSNTRIIGCQLFVKTALAAGETWDAAYVTGATQSIATNQAVAQNTKVNKWFDVNAATDIASDEVDITIQRNSNPGVDTFTAQGEIEAVVYVKEFATWANE